MPLVWYTVASGAGYPLAWMVPVELAGLALLAGSGLTGLAAPVGLGILGLGIPAAAVMVQRGPLLLAVPLGGLLLVAAELAYLSADLRPRGATEAAAVVLRGGPAAAVAIAGMAAGLLVVAVGGLPVTGGLDLTLVGVAAVLILLGGAAWLTRSRIG